MHHKTIIHLSYIIIFFFLWISCSENSKPAYDLKIHNTQVINLQTGSIQNLDIFINEGKIVKLDSVNTVTNTNALQNVDGTGKYTLPGFWDNHVHFRGGDSLILANKNFLKLFLANGITTVRDAGGDLTTSVISWKKSIENGNLDGPTIFTSGPKIDGPSGSWAGSLQVTDDVSIDIALDSLEKIPVDFVKLYDSKISGDAYLKTIEAAENRGLITSGHMPFTVTLEETILAGLDAVEHLYYIMKGCSGNEQEITAKLVKNEMGFWDAMPLLQSTYQDSIAKRTFNQLKSNNVFVVPTLHIGHTLSYLEENDHSKDPYLNYMSAAIIKTYEGRINRVKYATAKTIADRKALDSFFGELALNLNKSGVSLLAGSDSGAYNSFTYPGVSLHKELEAMVSIGISPLEALRTSAYNGSKFLKKDNDYGEISENKIADLVLLNDNPLKDIKNSSDIFMVIKKGRYYNSKQLDSLLKSAVIKP
ncbi:amidohydrolase family protein [Maribacter sp. CXY002]|uniref:amidohydrolase family protein n=1 Tax=Maribacter luteocoastalis TaxID=3407671 RepID=UPI003B682042